MTNDFDNSSGTVGQERFFAMVPKTVLYHPDLEATDIRVYGALSERAGKKAHAWPGTRRIASDLNMSRNTVKASIARLKAIGAVEVTPRQEDGRNLSHDYWLPFLGVGQPLTQGGSNTEPGGGSTIDPELDQGITRPTQLEIAPAGADYQSEMKDALIIACGWNHDDMSKSMWGQVEKYGKELREMGVEPEEVIRRAKVYRVNRSHQTLSPAALVKWWPDCAEPRVPLDKRRVTQAADRAEIERRLRDD